MARLSLDVEGDAVGGFGFDLKVGCSDVLSIEA
jgi:hypothetical protein